MRLRCRAGGTLHLGGQFSGALGRLLPLQFEGGGGAGLRDMGERRVAHVVDGKRQQHQSECGRKTVTDHVAIAAIAGLEVDREHQRHRDGQGDPRERRHHQAAAVIDALVGHSVQQLMEQVRHLGDNGADRIEVHGSLSGLMEETHTDAFLDAFLPPLVAPSGGGVHGADRISLSGRYPGAIAGRVEGAVMSVLSVLLPVFVQVGLTFALLIWMFLARRSALVSRQTKIRDIALGQPNWPVRATQIGNCYRNQFELPVLFYVLIAIALPIRHADLVIVVLSWVFVVTRFVHAGIFVSSNDLGRRSTAWGVGALVLLVMWVYFALRILLLI